ncbi:MAG: hypothetical protein U0S36_13705 [Candidatus Nanopelagicales bacterium]
MSEQPGTEPDDRPRDERPLTLLVCVGVAVLEAVAVAAYTIAILVSGLQNPGSIAAPWVEGVIYLLFVGGIALVAQGLRQRRRWSRTPFITVQLFGLVVAYTLGYSGEASAQLLGTVVGAVSLVGLLLAFVGRALDR